MTPCADLIDAPTYVRHGPPQGQWTVAAWERLPDDGTRYEVLEGILYMTTAPSFFHQWILTALTEKIGFPVKQQQLGIYLFAPIGLIFSPTVAVQPDFVVILTANLGIIQGGRLRGAPDLVVEVLSPGNTARAMADKYTTYATFGVPEYAVIDPASRILTLHRLVTPGNYATAQPFPVGTTVTFACLPTLPLAVADLFAGAPDTTLDVT